MKTNGVMTALMLLGVIDAQEQGLIGGKLVDANHETVTEIEHSREKEVPSPLYCKAKDDGTVACLELAHFHSEVVKTNVESN